jgi:hypothetical protein
MTESFSGGGSAASLLMRAADAVASAVVGVARQLLTDLERGHRIDAAVLRRAMEAAFGASDAAGAWDWKAADLHHRHRHRKRPRSSHLRHMKPGLRGRYPGPIAKIACRHQQHWKGDAHPMLDRGP